MTTDLPELKYLDEAARAAGWENYRDVSVSVPSYKSVVAHAATLQKLAELEAENAWRPIEEYQSDHPGPYQPHIFCAHDEKRWIRMGRYDVTLKRWYYSGTNERSQWAQVEGDAPTHFRPLPSPPKGPDA